MDNASHSGGGPAPLAVTRIRHGVGEIPIPNGLGGLFHRRLHEALAPPGGG